MRILFLLMVILALAACKNSNPTESLFESEVIADKQAVDSYFENNDAYELDSVYQKGKQICFDVGYSGGCKEHQFVLAADDGIIKTMPPGVRVLLVHEDNNDACEAYLRKTIRIDIGSLEKEVEWLRERERFLLFVNSPGERDSVAFRIEVVK